MRGFAFSVDMLYGTLIVVLLFSILIHAAKPVEIPQQSLLQIQAKDAVLVWFYSTPNQYNNPPNILTACPLNNTKPCACDTGFRPRVTTSILNPSLSGSWVSQQVCVVSP